MFTLGYILVLMDLLLLFLDGFMNVNVWFLMESFLSWSTDFISLPPNTARMIVLFDGLMIAAPHLNVGFFYL